MQELAEDRECTEMRLAQLQKSLTVVEEGMSEFNMF